MSAARRRRDEIAPSLFPFLAVLLCTMGSLVLILMLIVANAQASAKQIANAQEERREETESAIELAQRAIQKQLDAGRIDLEKRRLELQHLENHIQELLDEMSELTRTAELLQADRNDDLGESERIAEKVSELEQQLAEAKTKLDQQLEKPDGDKPIFAIIPYDGQHGTHRRPIYIECTSEGLVVQPEGVRISLDDLQPPHGPGNPLDAALRTIRSAYTPANLAVTSTAYPLLIVRPDGVRTYALARAAMNGWDDQFGYELVDEELDLAFPEGEPGLAPKIAKALELARQRQAALVMAMPQKYRRSSLRQLQREGGGGSAAIPGGSATSPGGTSWNHGGSSDDLPFGDSGGNAAGTANPSGPTNTLAGERGGLAGDGLALRDSLKSGGQPNGYRQNGFGQNQSGQNDSMAGGVVSEASQFGDSLFQPWNISGQTRSDATGEGIYENMEQAGSTSGLGGQGSSATTGSTSSADSSQAGSQQSGQAGGSASSLMSSGQMSASGEQISLPSFGLQSSSGEAASASQAGSQSSTNGPNASSGSSNSSADNSPQAGSGSSSHRASNGNMTPVAASRGRGWAWSQGPPTQTPVIRSLHLVCTEDRWVLQVDAGKTTGEVTIDMSGSLQARAEKLADAIRRRVDSWGLALSNGYWQPVLVVDVAPAADWRFQQLVRMFEGSGIEVRRRDANENR